MSWIDDLLGKVIMLAGVELPMRKNLNFVQGDGVTVTIEDDTTLGATTITIDGGAPSASVTVDQAPTVSDSGKSYNNVGASGQVTITLPASPLPVGVVFRARVADAQYVKLKANTGQTIQMDAIVTASAGYVRSNYQGASIQIESVSANRWFCSAIQGPWTADS